MARVMTGVVVANKNNKTITVSVQTSKTHPLYKKKYFRTKKYQVHDENNEANIGDRVSITETRPISATKRFKLTAVLLKGGIEHSEEEEAV